MSETPEERLARKQEALLAALGISAEMPQPPSAEEVERETWFRQLQERISKIRFRRVPRVAEPLREGPVRKGGRHKRPKGSRPAPPRPRRSQNDA